MAWRLAPLLVIALAVGAASWAAGAGGGEEGFIPMKESECYRCHKTDAQPLRAASRVVAPAENLTAPVGEVLEVPLQVQNGWKATSKYTQSTMSIVPAPSLRFNAGFDPVQFDAEGEVEVTADGLQTGVFSGFIVIEVQQGATELNLSLAPESTSPTTGPNLMLRIYPGVSEPTGDAAVVRNEAGRGQAETFDAGPEQMQAMGTGNWTIEVVYEVRNQTGGPLPFQFPAGNIPFRVTGEFRQVVTGLRAIPLDTREWLEEGESVLFTYQVIPDRLPEPGEKVRFILNTTMYYDHSDKSTVNWGNITDEYEWDVVPAGDEVEIRPAADFRPPRPVLPTVTMDKVSEAVGYASTFLLVSSIWSGGMLGKASRRQLNRVFGTAKRRVAFHNVLSYGIILAAVAHMVLFLVETLFHWGWGLVWGGLAILGMFLLGVTGALQVPMIRRWNYGVWKWSHWGLTVATIVLTAAHIFLEGANFPQVADAVGWKQPLVPSNLQ